MFKVLEPYLPELGAPLIATAWFLVGLYFALRERAASKAEKLEEQRRNAA